MKTFSRMGRNAAAILLILGSVARAQASSIGDLKSELRTKEHLGAVMSALALYLGDHLKYPTSIEAILNMKYFPSKVLPDAETPPYHAPSNHVLYLSDKKEMSDTGGWAYVNNPNSPNFGEFFVNCRHADHNGRLWSEMSKPDSDWKPIDLPDANTPFDTLIALRNLRAANAMYYADHDGAYPTHPSKLVPKYMKRIPALKTRANAPTSQITIYKSDVCKESENIEDYILPSKLKNTGGWGYIVDSSSIQCDGFLFIDSLDSDPKGRPWYKN